MTTQMKPLLTALRDTLAGTPGLAAVQIAAGPGPFDTAPLPAGTLALTDFHRLSGAEPADALGQARFELTLWRRDGDRQANAVALVELADAAIDRLLADPTQGGLCSFAAGAAATEVLDIGPVRSAAPPLGSIVVRFGCRLLVADALAALPQSERVTIDGQSPWASGPHTLTVSAWQRRRADRQFAGLDGTIGIDLGASVRPMKLAGRIVGADRPAVAAQMAAIESLLAPSLHELAAPDGRMYSSVRVEEVRWSPMVHSSSAACVGYEIQFVQLGS